MNARTIRRAAERKARKLASKTASQYEETSQERPEPSVPTTNPSALATHKYPLTPARLEANRANAALSTGPKSETGRKRSSLNAVKTALTGRTVLLPTDDVERYETLIADWQAELQPQGPRESALVQSIADSHWRTERIIRLEYALYAQGRRQFEAEFAEEDGADASARIEAKTYLAYEKQLRNLAIQESRLRRQREKDLRELQTLQEERRAQQTAEAEQEQKVPSLEQKATTPQDGFVFESGKSHPFLTTPNTNTNSSKPEKQDGALRQAA